MITNPFEDDGGTYRVLVNDQRQHSLWPADIDVPAGWSIVLEACSRPDCSSYIEANWGDIRPTAPTDMTSRCVHELFEEQAGRTPDAMALVAGAQRLSYGELDARAGRLAGLLAGDGVAPGTVVGVHMERGADMVVALLAVLKAGAGYAMLDVDFPAERLSGMAADAGITTVISEPDLAGERLRATRPLPAGAGGARPDDIACVMFTSGSTGRPKGVAAPHSAITATLTGQDYAPFGPGAVWLQCAPVSWDAFALELWGPLLNGGTCVLHPGGRADPLLMSGLAAEHGITSMYLSGSLFNVIVDECPAVLTGIRDLIVGGETLSAVHVAQAQRRWPELRLRNGYGPVEGMVFLTTHPVTEADTADGQVPIGRPLAGKQVQVLDERLRPAAQGELYSAGLGLALGYVGRPGLTAGRFVANPHGAPGERMYRTGDLARRRADGTLEFLGRSDDQVKVRGHRIELGDVQSAIATHPAVATSAAVLAEGHLVCFYTCRGGTVPAPEIRGHLATLLPDYMVPTRVFPMRHLPVTAHGKVNRAELARQAKQAMHVHGPACGRFCVGP